MDLTNFRLHRSPRAANLDNKTFVPVRPAARRAKTKRASQAFGADLDPLYWADQGRQPETGPQQLFGLVGEMDRWLVDRGDRPSSAEFAAERDSARGRFPSVTDGLFEGGRQLLAAALISEVDIEPDQAPQAWLRLTRLTRLLLVLDVADPTALPDEELGTDVSPDVVFDLLQRRFPVLPPGTWKALAGKRTPVRDLTVADLFVVRSEWSCYRAGEIAAITNVLAGETFSQRSTLTREEHVVERTDTELSEFNEQSEEDATTSEMSREVDRAASIELSAEGSVDVSGQYGVTQFGVSGAVSGSAALSENTRQATRLSRDVVTKAVSRVESRVREERVRTWMTRSEDRTSHVVDNSQGGHQRGVYRWVDRIDRYQVFRYPHRLQLEFEIPEPGEYLRYRLLLPGEPIPGGVDEPPAFEVVANEINRENYAGYANSYRAVSLPAPPDELIAVSGAETLTVAAEPVSDHSEVWNAPVTEKKIEVTLPSGYAATGLHFAGTATPVRANWRVEAKDEAIVNGKRAVEGFHHVTMTVAAGGRQIVKEDGGVHPGLDAFTVQLTNTSALGGDDRASRQLADASLTTRNNAIDFREQVVDKVALAVSVSGSRSAAVAFEIRCVPLDRTFAEWQNTVFDMLLDAWRAWNDSWRRQQQDAAGPRLAAVDAGSPALNKELVHIELKRMVITWLLGEQEFAGVDAMASGAEDGAAVPFVRPPDKGDRRDHEAPDVPWSRYDLDKARASAPEIQFLEQAFEWGNLSYTPYPYFWARSSKWDTLSGIRGADPDFVRFLSAGSVRVVVPARPAFERAVLHWLVYGQPFLGEPLPIPGDAEFVSVATEIRDLTQPPIGGEPGESWEARLPTTLMWLDPDEMLPRNEDRKLGADPHAPNPAICGP